MSEEQRFPGEWEPHKATWIFWPTSAHQYLYGSGGDFALVQDAFLRLVDILSAFEPVRVGADPSVAEEARRRIGKRALVIEIPLDDAWARDAGPTFLSAEEVSVAVCWKFTGWGGRFQSFGKDASASVRIAEWEHAHRREPDFAMEGGGILSDGAGTVLTTAAVLHDPGRAGVSVEGRASRLCKILNAMEVLELPAGFSGDDTGGHVDVIASISPDGTILLNSCVDSDDPNHRGTSENLRYLAASRREVVPVPQPRASFSGGSRLAYSYLNFYPANDCLLVPCFGDPGDDYALGLIAERFPGREPIPFEARPFYLGGGGIHCVTQPVF